MTSTEPILAPPPSRPTLASKVPAGGTKDPAEILSLFLEWVDEIGLPPIPRRRKPCSR